MVLDPSDVDDESSEPAVSPSALSDEVWAVTLRFVMAGIPVHSKLRHAAAKSNVHAIGDTSTFSVEAKGIWPRWILAVATAHPDHAATLSVVGDQLETLLELRRAPAESYVQGALEQCADEFETWARKLVDVLDAIDREEQS